MLPTTEPYAGAADLPRVFRSDTVPKASLAERKTLIVAAMATITMVVELLGGTLLGSLALTADGLHMASHAVAMGIAVFTYSYARRHASNPRFAFGTGKVNALGGYTGATLLGVTALWIAMEGAERAWNPVAIQYRDAIGVAILGLTVNIISAWILRSDHQLAHGGQDSCDHTHDHNLRAAYLHVLADAATSLLAIAALLAARQWGIVWLDAAVGIAGATLVAWWSIGLLRISSSVLLDHQGPESIQQRIRTRLESDGDRVADLRCWAVAPGRYAAIISLRTQSPRPVGHYKRLVSGERRLAWTTIEVND
jgi:cation diffusion facilitator family transporter